MRLLLLSDVHANLEAAQACLDAAPAHDWAINLGDLVGYGASPNEVLVLLRDFCRRHVRGNHDAAVAGLTSLDTFNPLAALAVQWTRQALSAANTRWLREVPSGPLRIPGLKGLLWAHGSPFAEDEYLIEIRHASETLLRVRSAVTFFGHSHLQGGFGLAQRCCTELHPAIAPGNGFASCQLTLDRAARYLINPGSVGQPRDGDWRAAFALYDTERAEVTFYRVPYDVARSQQRILDAGLPERLADRLSSGH